MIDPSRAPFGVEAQAPAPRGRRGFLLSAISACFASACVNRLIEKRPLPPLPGIAELFQAQAKLYPAMEGEDLYKLLYQATMGPSAFFIGGESGVLRGLQAEIKQLAPAIHDGEAEYEFLCQERGLARINLRPFLRNGGKAEEMAHALCLTTHSYRGEVEELDASLDWVTERLEELGFATEKKDWRKLITQMRNRGFPPGIHSENYAITYRPAYRILQIEYVTDALYGGRGDLYRPNG